ncbi:hypothetical protein EDD85DRAFT_254154 [Armillaria nabsnona]|nr:hypothetical protein EDD85DRAFT_254154 [Armillaria nabsnona]
MGRRPVFRILHVGGLLQCLSSSLYPSYRLGLPTQNPVSSMNLCPKYGVHRTLLRSCCLLVLMLYFVASLKAQHHRNTYK